MHNKTDKNILRLPLTNQLQFKALLNSFTLASIQQLAVSFSFR